MRSSDDAGVHAYRPGITDAVADYSYAWHAAAERKEAPAITTAEGAIEVGFGLAEMISAGLTIKPSDLTPGEIASLLGFHRGRNRWENERDKKGGRSSAQTEQEKKKSRERYKGRD